MPTSLPFRPGDHAKEIALQEHQLSEALKHLQSDRLNYTGFAYAKGCVEVAQDSMARVSAAVTSNIGSGGRPAEGA